MEVFIPSPLFSYTNSKKKVECEGNSLEKVLLELDKNFKGIRFRIVNEQNEIREHINFFVNGNLVKTIKIPLKSGDKVHIICALSGG
ncbi:MoaD/ThiS family protein [bacterium]|nr:MoaD/ThiS family protein [bacterium]